MANIVVFDATGYVGGNIASEPVSRGHHVTSYSRNLPTGADAGGRPLNESGEHRLAALLTVALSRH